MFMMLAIPKPKIKAILDGKLTWLDSFDGVTDAAVALGEVSVFGDALDEEGVEL